MKNRLTDLNNHLFAQLERLSDEDLSEKQLATEVKRAEAVAAVSTNIIRNADLKLRAVALRCEYGGMVPDMPLIEGQKNEG